MATPQQIETKLRAPRCLNNIPFSARAQCPGTGTKSGQGLWLYTLQKCLGNPLTNTIYNEIFIKNISNKFKGCHIFWNNLPTAI